MQFACSLFVFRILVCCVQAADRALAEASKGRPKVRPINPKEAARGKVDYVQVGTATGQHISTQVSDRSCYSWSVGSNRAAPGFQQRVTTVCGDQWSLTTRVLCAFSVVHACK